MATIRTIILGVFLGILCAGVSGQIQSVRKIYTSEIGVRELTGRNDGQRVETYLASCGLPKGYAWCAAFVTFTFKTAGVKAIVSAYAPAWFPAKNTIYVHGGKHNKTPQTADVFGIYFASKKRIAHVGFIDEWSSSGSYAITVEGNTNEAGSREGDGVYKKRRLKTQIYKVSRFAT